MIVDDDETLADEEPIRATLPVGGPTLPRVDARGTALVTLAVLAVLLALHLAANFVIPLVVSILTAYALEPLVRALERRHVPRIVGASLILGLLLGAAGCAAYAVRGQADAILNQMPTIVHRLVNSIDALDSDGSGLSSLRAAAAALEEATDQASGMGAPAPARGAPVVVVQPAAPIKSVLMAGGMEMAAFMGQAVMVVFLVFFLLLAGDQFKRKFVKLAGHTLSEKKITVQMFDQINLNIRRYMLMLLVTNAALGIVTWVTFRLLGLENAGTWAIAAAVLHLVPYFGALLVAVTTAAAAFLQFGTLQMAGAVGLASLFWAVVIGTLLTTWMTGRLARMNAVAVFIALLLFTFLWGIWGALLSVPIAMVVKVVSDHIVGLEAFAEFLGD